MKAATHTEVYRRFTGRTDRRRWRGLPVFTSGLRTALKNKWAWLLFVPPALGTVVFAFVVYAKFSIEAGVLPGAVGGGTDPGVALIGEAASRLIEVRDQIVGFVYAMSFFALLAVAWYGSGLICEDRRVGAHLLYFARPITRLDYGLGKLAIAAAFALATVLVPGWTICLVAVLASPEWSFLTQQWIVIVHTLVYSLVWALVLSSLVLAISSITPRKVFALVAVFAAFFLSEGVGQVLSLLLRERAWRAIAPMSSLRRVAFDLFGAQRLPGMRQMDWDPWISWSALAAMTLLAWIVIASRLRRMEVVA